MHPKLQLAKPSDAPECLRIRGLTRENAVAQERLRSLGITAESWAAEIESGELPGFVCTDGASMVGYCFGASRTGEVIVLALLPEYEGKGLGRKLLNLVAAHLQALGHQRLYLGCSSNPAVRSYGFYRHLGWRSTGAIDHHGDEVLELVAS